MFWQAVGALKRESAQYKGMYVSELVILCVSLPSATESLKDLIGKTS